MATTYDVDRILRQPQRTAPIAPIQTRQPSVGGWFEAMGGEIARQPAWQWAASLLEPETPDEPDYNPYEDDELEPYMAGYAREFLDVGSRAEALRLTERIRLNEERRANSARELGLGGILLSELFNPVNLIPLPGLVGSGLIKGALKGTTSFGALLTAEEIARHGIDPTATTDESVDNIVYGSIFGGLIGGVAGVIGAKDINRLASQYQAEHARIVRGELPATGGEAFIKSGTFYEAKPTGPEGSGVAPAFGLEKTTQLTLWGQLKASNIRSVGDLADMLLGDFGTKSTQNAAGVPTAPSVTLAAGYWRGLAADALRSVEDAYVRYRLGGEGKRVAGLNVPVTGARISEFFGKRPSDGKMTFAEFKEQVFRAHRSDGLRADDPHVKEAAEAVRGFFDQAMIDGTKKGTIRSAEGFKRVLERRLARGRQLSERYNELLAKPDRTPNEEIALDELEGSMARTMQWLSARLMEDLEPDATLADVIRGFEVRQLQRIADARETARSLRKKGKERREGTHRAMQWVEEQIARDKAVLEYLDRLEAERGLTDKQRAYRDDLRELMLAVNEADPNAPPWEPFASGQRASLAGETRNAFRARFYKLQDLYRQNRQGFAEYNTTLRKALESPKVRAQMTPEQQELADKLLTLIDSDVDMRVGNTAVGTGRREAGYLGFATFYPDGATPEVVMRGLKGKKQMRILLHEAAHVAYIGKYGFFFNKAGELGPRAVELRAELDALFIEAARRKGWQKHYGMSNLDEFVTEALTEPGFQKWLKGEQLWQRVVDYVRKVIGLDPKYTDLLSDSLAVLDDLRIEAEGALPIDKRDGNYGNDSNYVRGSREGGAGPDWRDERLFMTPREKQYLDALEQRLAGKEVPEPFTGPKNEKAYLPRFWRIDKVLEDEAGEQRLRAILFQWFTENPLEGAPNTPSMIEGRVEQAIANIVKEGELDEMQLFQNGAGAGMMSQKGRALDIPNELVADFIENDVEKILRTYSHRFGVINEMTGMLGDTDALDAIDDAMIQAALEVDARDAAKAKKMLAGTRADLERARDTLTGRIYSTEPDMMSARRRAQILRAYGITTSLGGAALSSIPELARGLMVHGFARTLGLIFDGLGNPSRMRELTDEMRTLTGEGNDAIMATGMARVVEQGGPSGVSPSRAGRAAHGFADFSSGPFFNLNLLAPFTDFMKRSNLFWTNHFMLEDITRLAETGDAKLAEQLASYGISLEDARAIAAQPISRDGRLFEANVGEWTDDALALRYRTAVAGMVRRTIVTPGNADIPEIAKGFIAGREYPLLTLPFQFMAYGFGAANKVLISGLQGRDRSAVMGIAAIMALGWMTEAIKVPSYIWDKMTVEEKTVRAFDRSGLVGIYSDVPTMIETATMGQVGLRPLMGLDPYVRNADGFDAMGELGGPVVSRVADIARLFVDPETDADDIGGTVRRSVPLNNLFYLKGLFSDLEQGVTDTFKPEPAEELVP